MEMAETSIRIHVATPGPRSGEPFSISVETVNAGELTEDKLAQEVDSAMKVYEQTKAAMDAKAGGGIVQHEYGKQPTDAAKGGK